MFRFEVRQSEPDFIEFNRFHIYCSHYMKKQLTGLRVMMLALGLMAWLLPFISIEFSWRELIARGIVFLLFTAVLFFSVKRFLLLITKHTLKKQLKKGDRLYSANSVLEFGTDAITETTDINRTELKYSAVDSIYLHNGKVFYIYLNSMQGYILPVAAFESATQYNDFVDFIQKKTNRTINIVNEKR